MSNAISERSKEDEQARRVYIHEKMLYDFIARWMPSDNYDKAQFCAELTNIVRQVSADAQQPVVDQYLKVMAMLPMVPFK